MFSYRHAFHAGNHADVLKHTVLVAMLRHLTQKDAALTVVDTHAGAGLYRIDGEYSDKSGEAREGIVKLYAALDAGSAPQPLAPALQDYLALLDGFNAGGSRAIYPGSPLIAQRLLRAHDRLKLFEPHPSDGKLLQGHVDQLDAGRQVVVRRDDGFAGLAPLLPPPSRRALVLIDPSYEIKSDYAKVGACLQDSLRRFSTGSYAIWYPVIPRPEAHSLPRRLKTLATQAGKPWLHATLAIGAGATPAVTLPDEPRRGGLSASGMFIVNPPHPLKAALAQALPQLLVLLGRGRGRAYGLDSGG